MMADCAADSVICVCLYDGTKGSDGVYHEPPANDRHLIAGLSTLLDPWCATLRTQESPQNCKS